MKAINRIVLAIAIMIAFCSQAMAQSAVSVLDKTIADFKKSGVLSADYSVMTDQGSTKGSIVMQGNKFRILSGDIKCWFDGTNQWSYSPSVGEVNLVNPSAEELQSTNPYAAVSAYKKQFKVAHGQSEKENPYHTIVLMPRSSNSDIKQAVLHINKTTNRIKSGTFVMKNNTKVTVLISNYKTQKSVPASTFEFDKSAVPAGTEVVDLR